MLVEHISLETAQQTPLSRPSRKRRVRGVDGNGSRERAKTPRRQVAQPRITKPEPDEDSGLGFDDPGACPAETACLLRTDLVATVRGARRSDEHRAGLVHHARTASTADSPRAFPRGVNPVSKCGKYRLVLVREPETRHRARYQTEGSRGAVKDVTGKTSPQVVLYGYTEPCQLQMYVGSDADGCSPHLFYQACRVTGKTASASDELLLNGTVVIQTLMTPETEGGVSARCDCLGILKQRNVDIESRVAAAGGAGTSASAARRPAALRKGARTTSCRLVFRVTIVNGLGQQETLQIASRSILCTQPQGVPEVTKLSLREAPSTGGSELIVLGKNFVKDSRVVFTETNDAGVAVWTKTVTPHKDHLQAVHLVCDVPAYWDARPCSARSVSLTVRSGDKESDSVAFTFLPASASPTELPPPPDRSDPVGGGRLLPNGVSQAAIAINRHFAETGEIVLGSGEERPSPAGAAAAQLTERTAAVSPPSGGEEVAAVMVPVVTAGQEQNVFVAVTLPAGTDGAALFQPSTIALTTASELPPAPAATAQTSWPSQQAPATTAQTSWSSQPAEGTAQESWVPPTTEVKTVESTWPVQPAVASQDVWTSPRTETATQKTWSPQAEASQKSWSPQAETSPKTWSPQAEATVQETWSPQTEAVAQETWTCQAETVAQGTWTSQAEATTQKTWSPETGTSSQKTWSPQAEAAAQQQTTVQNWTPQAEAAPQKTWTPQAGAAAQETWTTTASEWPSAAPAAAAEGQAWTQKAQTWSEPSPPAAADAAPRPAEPAVAAPAAWAPQPELQAWAADEVRSWTSQQLADVLEAGGPRPQPPAAPGAAPAAPGPGPAAHSDPMWSDPPFGGTAAAAASDDPLADMPTGMGLIEYINGDINE